MCRNNFDWDCNSSAHSFQIDDGSLSGHGCLCGFTLSGADDASSIENLMLFHKVESEVWDVERDVPSNVRFAEGGEKEAVERLNFVLVGCKNLIVLCDIC